MAKYQSDYRRFLEEERIKERSPYIIPADKPEDDFATDPPEPIAPEPISPPAVPAREPSSDPWDFSPSKIVEEREGAKSPVSQIMGIAGDVYNRGKKEIGADELIDAPAEEFNRLNPGAAAKIVRGTARAAEAFGGGMKGLADKIQENPLTGAFELVKAPVEMTMASPGVAWDLGTEIGKGKGLDYFANRSPDLLNFLGPGMAIRFLKGFAGKKTPKTGAIPVGKETVGSAPSFETKPVPSLSSPEAPPSPRPAPPPTPQAPIESGGVGFPEPPIQKPSLNLSFDPQGGGIEQLLARLKRQPVPEQPPVREIPAPPLAPVPDPVAEIPSWANDLGKMRYGAPTKFPIDTPPMVKGGTADIGRPTEPTIPVEMEPMTRGQPRPGMAGPGGNLPLRPETPFEPRELERTPPDNTLFAKPELKAVADIIAKKGAKKGMNQYHDSLFKEPTPDELAVEQESLRENPQPPDTPESFDMGERALPSDYPGIARFVAGEDLGLDTDVIEGPIQYFADILSGYQVSEGAKRPSQVKLGTIAKHVPEAGPLVKYIQKRVQESSPDEIVMELGLTETDPVLAEKIIEKGTFEAKDLWDAILREAFTTEKDIETGETMKNTVAEAMDRDELLDEPEAEPAQKSKGGRPSKMRSPRAGNLGDIPGAIYDALFNNKVSKKILGKPGEGIRGAVGDLMDSLFFQPSYQDTTGIKNIFHTAADVGRRKAADIGQGVRKALMDQGSWTGKVISGIEDFGPNAAGVGRAMREYTQGGNPGGTIRTRSEIPGEVIKAFAGIADLAKFTPNGPKPTGRRGQRATQPFTIPDGSGNPIQIQPGQDLTGYGLDELPPGKWEHFTGPVDPQALQAATAAFTQAFAQWATKVGRARADKGIEKFIKEFEIARDKTDAIHQKQLEQAARRYERSAAAAQANGNLQEARDYLAAAANARSPDARFQSYMSRDYQGQHEAPLDFDETHSQSSTGKRGFEMFNTALYRGAPDIMKTIKSMENYGNVTEKRAVVEQYEPELRKLYADELIELWKTQQAAGKKSGLVNSNGQEPATIAEATQAAYVLLGSPKPEMTITPEGLPPRRFGKIKVGSSDMQVPEQDWREMTWGSKPLFDQGGEAALNFANRVGVFGPLESSIVGAKNTLSNAVSVLRGLAANVAEDPGATGEILRAFVGQLTDPKLNTEVVGQSNFTLSDESKGGEGLIPDAFWAQERGARFAMSGDVTARAFLRAMRRPVTARLIQEAMQEGGMTPAQAQNMAARAMDAVERLTSRKVQDVTIPEELRPWVARAVRDIDKFGSDFIADPRFAPPALRAAKNLVQFATFNAMTKINSSRRLKEAILGGDPKELGKGKGKRRAALLLLTPAIAYALMHQSDPEKNVSTARGGAGQNTIDIGGGAGIDPTMFTPEIEITKPIVSLAKNLKSGAREGDPDYQNWSFGVGNESLPGRIVELFDSRKKIGSSFEREAGDVAKSFIPHGRPLADLNVAKSVVTGENPYRRKSSFLDNALGDIPFAMDFLRYLDKKKLDALKAKKNKDLPDRYRLDRMGREFDANMEFDFKHKVDPRTQRVLSLLKFFGVPTRQVERKQ